MSLKLLMHYVLFIIFISQRFDSCLLIYFGFYLQQLNCFVYCVTNIFCEEKKILCKLNILNFCRGIHQLCGST